MYQTEFTRLVRSKGRSLNRIVNTVFDPRRLLSLRYLFRYIYQYRNFKKLHGNITHIFPILIDYDDLAGNAKGHYFHQDLLVASFIHKSNPVRHIDIGSRIDGFVAHVASFRKIEIVDVRDLADTGHSNIIFVKADLMDETNAKSNITDSISCLHAIEHFGLGRYGESLDPDGHIKGYNNILKMLRAGGFLYISFPIANSNEVHFNAHRVFSPTDILNWAANENIVELIRFDFVDDSGALHTDIDIMNTPIDVRYGCGIYTLRKIENRTDLQPLPSPYS